MLTCDSQDSREVTTYHGVLPGVLTGKGAYTARFLAQMLDYVGLLSAGNEEMLSFGQWILMLYTRM